MFTLVLALHIAAGSLSLAASAAALWATKGGSLHRRAGRVFLGAMIAVGVSALVLASLHPSAFLFSIGIFSLYLVLSGAEAARPGLLRRWAGAVPVAMVVVGTAMLGLAAAGAVRQPSVLAVFGAIGLALAVQDLAVRSRGERAPGRVQRHLARMLGATAASWTAFVVVNFTFLPPLVAWLGPTALVLPAIVYWARRLRLRAMPA
jgi:uncharacterized membrane protein